jgi:hypothetical protein
LLVLLAVAPLGYYVWAKVRGEHFYRGRPTSYWSRELVAYAQDIDWSPPWPDEVLNSIGGWYQHEPAVLEGSAAATPVLLDLLKDSNPRVRSKACSALLDGYPTSVGTPDLVRALHVQDAVLRVRILCKMQSHSSECGDTVSAVTELLRDQDYLVRQEATETLASIGPSARSSIPALRVALTDEHWQVHDAAEDALALLDSQPGRPRPVGEVIDRLLRRYRREKLPAPQAGSRLSVYPPLSLPSGRERVLVEELGDLARSLAAYGKEAVPHLLKWVQVDEWHVRYIAIYAVEEITSLKPVDPLSKDREQRELAIKAWQEWYAKRR